MTVTERVRRLEDRLWKAADQLRWHRSTQPQVLGLIFLRYADVRFTQIEL